MSDRRRCCVISCSFAKKPISDGVRLYGLPNDPLTRSQWCQWIGHENGNECSQKNVFVCSNHFAEEFKGNRKLKRGAVPTIPAINNDNLCNKIGEHHEQEPNNVHLEPQENYQQELVNESSDAQLTSNHSNVCEENVEAYQEEYMSQFVNVQSGPLAQLEQCQVSHLFGYSSIVEINMDQADIHLSMAENNAASVEQSQISFSSAPVNDVEDIFPKICDINENSHVENVSNMFFVTDAGNLLPASEQTQLSCNVGSPKSNNLVGESIFDDQSRYLRVQYDDSYHTETLFKEFTMDKNSNSCEGTSHIIIEETNIVEIPAVQKRKKCFVMNCTNPNNNTIHTFPAIIIKGQINQENLEKCRMWIKNSGNLELLNKFSSQLHGSCGLCSDHFDGTQYYNANSRKRLLPSAIPTLNCGSPISDENMTVYPKWDPCEIFADLTSNTESTHHGVNETRIEIDQQDNNESSKLDQNQKFFEDVMYTLEWRTCKQCKEKFFTKKTTKKKCAHSKPICYALSNENGFDPGDVPPELQGLSPIEEQLIARIHPVVQVYKVKGHQYGYKGNIINFPQDVKSLATKLPHNIKNLKSVVKVRTSNDATKMKDFHVRADVVRNALIWLRENNPFYFDIQISEENINLLPNDSNAYELLEGIDLEEQDEDSDNSEEHELITESNVPMVTVPSEEEQISNVINWPTIGKNPIDELRQIEGNVVKAFPTLFPRGTADLGHARTKKISDTTYFQHLMRYCDGRFAQHNRFRFFALNSLMRWSALTDGNIFIKRNPEFKNMSVRDLKEKVEKDHSLLKKIMFQASNIRGTKAFWHARGRELEAMVEQVGLPTLFITLSAADMHWPELYQLLTPNEDAHTMTEYRRRELIQQNPLIVDEFFLTRAETFLKEVLTPKYKVKDFWFRIEYQHRGSPHLHGLLWLEDAIDVSNVLNATEEEKDAIIKYFDDLICTMHPNINEAPAPTHPCRIKLSEAKDLKEDLAQLLNRVQRHTVCTPGYCLKKGNPPTCRFNFPAAMQECSKLDLSDQNNIKLLTARNDSRLNKFNPYIISTWRGNIDVSPVLSKKALINYLAKYISKSETRSQKLINLMKSIISDSDQNKPARHALQRMFIRTCSERDYSAQETCHILMGLKLYSRGARKLISINFNDSTQWQQVRKDGQAKTLSLLEQYKKRKEDKEMECLWNMAKYQKVSDPQKFNIIMVYPTIKLKTSSQDNESFYRQQCLLFLPWRDEMILQGDKLWEEVYNDNLPLIRQNQQNKMCLSGEPDEDAVYDEYEQELLPREQWMAISSMRSNQHTLDVQLGFRQIDMDKNWHEALSKYENVGGIPYLQSFIGNAKQDCASNSTTNHQFQFYLSPEQFKVVELAQFQILKCQNKLPADMMNENIPQKVIVQGKAGTGKSVIVSEIVRHVENELGHGSIIVLGPTGVSAVNVNGSTIQSKLKITSRNKSSNREEFVPLRGQAAHDFAQAFEKVKFVICDEFSMIGCSLLSKIDQRLRQATGNSEEDFGGLNVFFFGDIKQLSPVADCAAYSTNQKTLQTIRGKQLYDNMDAAFILTKIHRQNDSEFLQVLNNISEGKFAKRDYDLLSTRFITALPNSVLKEFRNALHLYPTLDRVQHFNKECLESLQDKQSKEPVPVACVLAKHNCPAASKGSISDAEGLEPVLNIAEGAKIMLRINMWTEKGLVNGAMGEIDEIIYSQDAHPGHDPPSVLVCKFPTYKGPYLDPIKKTVPIIPMTKSWVNTDGINCSREQFPLTIAYATSIHKSQGLTLLMAYVDIGRKEMSPGLSYVALSRVKSLEGLALEPFSFERLQSLSKSNAIHKRLAWEQLLKDKIPF